MYEVLLFLSFAGYYGLSQGCSCLPDPPTNKQLYCQADFALLVLVQSDLINPNDQQDFDDYYDIEILKTYKMEKSHLISDQTRVYTATNDALCGVSLQNGTRYVITGKVEEENQRMFMASCTSWIGYNFKKSEKKAKRYQKRC